MNQKLPWIDVALGLMGTKEIVGPKHNPKILEWAKAIDGWVKSFYTNDEIPWCGLFVGYCMHAVGLKPPPDMLAAKAWNRFGTKLDEPYYGCILVFARPGGGGHVGFAVGQDANSFHVLGGNQSNSVSTTKIAKDRLLGMRWPSADIKPKTKLQSKTLVAGLSTNEK